MNSYGCSFVFYADDRVDALGERIAAALEAEDLDFDPMTVQVEKIADYQEESHEGAAEL